MEEFRSKKSIYYKTCELCEGCPARQSTIDLAHEELQEAYDALPDLEKQQVTVPERYVTKDDGTGGIRSLAGFARGLAADGEPPACIIQ